MLKRLLLSSAIALLPLTAMAQQSAQTAETSAVIVNWSNLQTAISNLMRESEQKALLLKQDAEKAILVEDYWKRYVEGLKPGK